MLDAEVKMPEGGLSGLELCRVEEVGFNGKELADRLLPDVSETEWYKSEGAYWEPEWLYYYNGILGRENGGQKGDIGVGFDLYIISDHWEKCSRYSPIYQRSEGTDYSYGLIEDSGLSLTEEFPFASRAEIEEKAKDYLIQVIGLEDVNVLQVYSVNYHQLEKMQKEDQDKNGEPSILKPGIEGDSEYGE